MCTVSWVTEAQGYTLYQNRDESRTRAPERPPTHEMLSGVCYLAPTDGASDGTWILVNECGLTVTLLNAYRASLGAPRDSYETRGALVRGLADCIDAPAANASTSRRPDRVAVRALSSAGELILRLKATL